MATKTISIGIEAYNRLKDRKEEGESFSEVIERLVPKPIDFDGWLRRIEANPAGEELVKAVQQQIDQRRAPRNTGTDTHALSGHKHAHRPAKLPAKRRAPARR